MLGGRGVPVPMAIRKKVEFSMRDCLLPEPLSQQEPAHARLIATTEKLRPQYDLQQLGDGYQRYYSEAASALVALW